MIKKCIDFLTTQSSEIWMGGPQIVMIKIKYFIYLLREKFPWLFKIIACPVVFLEYVLTPLVYVRVGNIGSDRIGNLCLGPDMYLSEIDLNKQKIKYFDIFFFDGNICNMQLAKMIKRTLRINSLAKVLFFLNSSITYGQKHIIPINEKTVNLYSLRSNEVHFKFTNEEQELGQKKLWEMGIPEGSPFICFHARDSSYLNRLSDENVYYHEKNWDYHNYRDSRIENYLLAADELTKRGYYLIRMGSAVDRTLATSNPKIIDYASKYRSDFMDIYLSANCFFFIGSYTGLLQVPQIFRRPIACVNAMPFGAIFAFRDDYLHIPKKFWLPNEGRYMKTSEIFRSGADWFYYSQQYDDQHIELIENSPEEIRDLTLEMEERLKGVWTMPSEDENLQGRFWSLFKFNPKEFDGNIDYHSKIKARIGAKFLQQNRYLTE